MPISDVIALAAHATHYLGVFDKANGSVAQRIMLIARDGGCTCTVPAYGTQVHHAARDWAYGGQTNIDELGLACAPDNRMVEPGGWTTRINGDTDVEWIPPAHLDTGQARVNNYHRPERLFRPPQDEPTADQHDQPGGPEPNAA